MRATTQNAEQFADQFVQLFQELSNKAEEVRAWLQVLRSTCEEIAGCSLEGWTDKDVQKYASLALKHEKELIAKHGIRFPSTHWRNIAH